MTLAETPRAELARAQIGGDVIAMPSSSRAGLWHLVAVNVLAGATTACTCEAGQRSEYCQHRKEVDATEGAWGFHRCTECGVLMRLEFFHAGSGPMRIWSCPQSRQHSAHEKGTAMLLRTEQPWATGSRGSWRLL